MLNVIETKKHFITYKSHWDYHSKSFDVVPIKICESRKCQIQYLLCIIHAFCSEFREWYCIFAFKYLFESIELEYYYNTNIIRGHSFLSETKKCVRENSYCVCQDNKYLLHSYQKLQSWLMHS